MANSNGALTSSQGTQTLDCSANDTIAVTPTAGSFTLEYPIGTVLANGIGVASTYTLGPGQCRLTCISGSIVYALTDNVDSLSFSQAQVASVQVLALNAGFVIARGAPSLVLNDTSVGAGITDTPFPLVITIPGGTAPPTSTGMFRLTYCMSMTGGNAKTSTSRVGQAATKTYATATPIGGQSGLSSQISSVFITHLWMISSGVQRGHPANSGSSTSSNSVFALPAMNMALDVNFWIGFQFGTLNGGDTATLLNYMLEYLP
jgi:hypothetical protein